MRAYLVAIVVALLLLGAPSVAADGQEGEEAGPCVKVSVDPPGASFDPRCHPVVSDVWDELPI